MDVFFKCTIFSSTSNTNLLFFLMKHRLRNPSKKAKISSSNFIVVASMREVNIILMQ